MENRLFFIIENKKLYLEHVLVEYMNIPIFFLCKNENDYYIALNTDIEESKYIIVKSTRLNLYNMLHGQISMRDSILTQKEYWEVVSEDDINLDDVKKYPMNKIDLSCLPEENAMFQILTGETERFVKKYDDDFLKAESFSFQKTENVDFLLNFDSDESTLYVEMDSYIKKGELSLEGVLGRLDRMINILDDCDMVPMKKMGTVRVKKPASSNEEYFEVYVETSMAA